MLCGCPFAPSSGDTARTWIQAILKFRNNCDNYSPNTVKVEDSDTVNLRLGGETVSIKGDKLKKLAKDNLSSKADEVDNESEIREATKMSDLVYNVESITTNATANAFFKERLLEREKKLKAKKDLDKLDEMINKEKEKEKCIQKFLEKESKRQRRKQLEKDTAEELKDIKVQVQAQVESLKKVYSNKMGKLDQETERLKMEKMKQLSQLKIRITNMLIDQEIKGSVDNCKDSKPEEQEA